jgi:hypothetical protein
VISKFGKTPQSPPWEVALENLPKLSGEFYEGLLSRRSLAYCVRSIARVLKVTMKSELLEQFDVQPNFVANQKQSERNATDKSVISNLEISPAFKKLSFLSLIQWSNSAYPPASTKMHLYTIASISFVITRYSSQAMQAVYGTILLPYISSSHVALMFRLFENHHHRHNPANSSNIGIFHLPLTSTLQNCRSGDYAHIATHQRKTISTLISKCTYCILHGSS